MEDNGTGSAVGVLLSIFGFILIFGLSLFASKDSAKNRVSFIAKEYQESDSTVWFFVRFCVCGLGLLYYLYRRSVVMQIEESHQTDTDDPVEEETENPEPEADTEAETVTEAEHSPQPGKKLPKLETSPLEAELETLHRLKEKGLITDDEWTQKKRKLLGL